MVFNRDGSLMIRAIPGFLRLFRPLPHANLRMVTTGLLAIMLYGCYDSATTDPLAADAQGEAGIFVELATMLPDEGKTRWDSPWWSASDEELKQAIAEVDGAVTIGFKEPGSQGGVDIHGRRHASGAVVDAGLALLASRSVEVTRKHSLVPAVSAVVDSSKVADLRGHPLIDYIEPLVPIFDFLSNDSTWAADAIQAPLAWDSTTGNGVVVAVLDTGVQENHPLLDPVVPLSDCTGGSGGDNHGHGTEVAGMIAALLTQGSMTGAAHGVTLRSYRLGDMDPHPDYFLCGVQSAIADGADVINMSFGAFEVITSMADEIAMGYAAGIIFVAAGGNKYDLEIRFPANMSQVIAVLGVDQNNSLGDSVPSGPQVELVAPGVKGQIMTTCHTQHNPANCIAPGERPSSNNGNPGICDPDPEDPSKLDECATDAASSLAAPLVAAAAALLKAHQPGWSRDEIRNRLRATALDLGSPGHNNQYGFGLVQVFDALAFDLPDPPSVQLSGPTEMDPSDVCTWNAQVTAGLSPLKFQWFVHTYSAVGTNDPAYTGGVPGGTTGTDFNLIVEVTDFVGRKSEDEIIIELDESAPPCLI